MTDCFPPCVEGRGLCDTETLTCKCGWEYGEEDCSKTFYEILGQPYLVYSLVSITMSSIIFGLSSLIFEKAIEWKVAKLESPQRASLVIIALGSFGTYEKLDRLTTKEESFTL